MPKNKLSNQLHNRYFVIKITSRMTRTHPNQPITVGEILILHVTRMTKTQPNQPTTAGESLNLDVTSLAKAQSN